MGLLVEITIPHVQHIHVPMGMPHMRIRDNVARDPIFKQRISTAMNDWKEIKAKGLDILKWWELVVKPGIRYIAKERSREINLQKRGNLDMLLIQQAYIVNQIKHSNPSFETLTQLYSVQSKIRKWYSDLSQKIQTQSRKDEFQQSEQTRFYHHEECNLET